MKNKKHKESDIKIFVQMIFLIIFAIPSLGLAYLIPNLLGMGNSPLEGLIKFFIFMGFLGISWIYGVKRLPIDDGINIVNNPGKKKYEIYSDWNKANKRKNKKRKGV